MARPVCTLYHSRNVEMARKYTDEKKSLLELSEEYGLSTVRVAGLLREQGIELRREPRRIANVNRRSKDNRLVAIGARLHADRMRRGVSLPEYSMLLGLSETRLSEALQGLYNWRFQEIVRAAQVLGIDIEDFIKPPNGLLHG